MKIAVITGASSGMGREFVYRIDKDFQLDELWVIARREDRLLCRLEMDLAGKDVQEDKTLEEQTCQGHIQGFDDQCGEDSRRSSDVPLSCAHTTCIETQFL